MTGEREVLYESEMVKTPVGVVQYKIVYDKNYEKYLIATEFKNGRQMFGYANDTIESAKRDLDRLVASGQPADRKKKKTKKSAKRKICECKN